jgi:predicted Zn-dependent protease
VSDHHLQIARLIEVGRTQEARKVLGRAMQEAPEDPSNLYFAGAIAFEEDKVAEAREAVEQLLARAPDHHRGRELLVRVMIEEKRYVEAERLVIDLLREDPDDADLYATYAYVMMLTLHVDKSRALVDEALRLEPANPLAQVLDVLLRLAKGSAGGAMPRLAEMIGQSPEAAHVAWTAALVLSEQGRTTEALEIARSILRAQPNDEDVVDFVITLKQVSHWSSWPLRPLHRYGWAASAVIWAVIVIGLNAARAFLPLRIALPLAIFAIAYMIYSWVQPPLLKKWLKARGF